MQQKALRTPDSCFNNLKEYPFKEHFVSVEHPAYEPLRMHYVEEGPRDAPPILLLHGCPAWSYLYRNVITALAEAGLHVIAPDHIGCGKSDKLVNRADYSYEHYVQCMQSFITQLNLCNITLVCQDWGGPIGLRCLAEMPERFDRVLITNTLLPNCELPPRGVEGWPGEIIENWVNFTVNSDDIPIGQIIQGVTCTDLQEDVIAGYDAPFPGPEYKQGMLVWPSLIPQQESFPGIAENRRAWQVIEKLDIPMLCAFSDSDPSTAAWEAVFKHRLHGAQNQSHKKILQAGHMVQEDKPEELVEIIIKFVLD